MSIKIINGECLEILKTIKENQIDSMVVDPPYGISFMGKKWDYDIPPVEVWQECLRVLKPGAYGLVACGTRTQHRMAVNLEDAGFEIRDVLAWVYGTGFPKSRNIGKDVDKIQGNERKIGKYRTDGRGRSPQKINNYEKGQTGIGHADGSKQKYFETKGNSKWEGWGTALKPAMELWTLIRKPLSEKTIAQNVLKHGTGGINIEACKVGIDKDDNIYAKNPHTVGTIGANGIYGKGRPTEYKVNKGRWPANLLHDGSPEVVGLFPDSKSSGGTGKASQKVAPNGIYGSYKPDYIPANLGGLGDSGSAARFFYCAKASKAERNKGLESFKTVKYNVPKEERTGKWKEENMVAVQLLKKVTSDMVQVSFSIGESGESIMVQCHKDFLSIILTKINKIIESKILPLLMHLLTKGSIQDVNLLVANGGNLVENVENLKKYLLTITKGNLELALGVSNVVLTMLFLIREEENWKQAINFHSTVKPIKLMRYLCRLITPKGGIVIDPYMGSGSTGIAAKLEGFNFVGIEKEEEYCEIAKARIKAYAKENK